MRLSISNIAWDVADDPLVAKLLQRHGIDAIDVAPGKYFNDPASTTSARILDVRRWWGDQGIAVIGMQALLFGTQGLNVFGSPTAQQAMLDHLRHVCRIGSTLGASLLTFGSPRNRDRKGLSDEQAQDVAVVFFRRLGDIAAEFGVHVCLEPNPPRYGANFMVTEAEAARVVAVTDHPAIRLQLDTGAVTMTDEDPCAIIANHRTMIGHVHASEPNLLPLGRGGTNHSLMGGLLRKELPSSIVTIEMLTTASESRLDVINDALVVAANFYGGIENED